MFVKLKKKYFEFWFKYKNHVNRSRKKILFYTDSRGHDVLGNFKKFAKDSYIEFFFKHYNVSYYICPEKYTTIVDFIILADKIDLTKYDHIIVHCGVVDFSPRPLSNIDNVKASKQGNSFFEYLFSSNQQYYNNPSDVVYYDEKTINIYSPQFFKEEIVPLLKKIDNLIWINSNHFAKGWEGNFKKGRPANIEEFVSKFDSILEKELKNVIDVKGWTDENIKEFTIDNIHFTRKGFKEMYKRIETLLQTL